MQVLAADQIKHIEDRVALASLKNASLSIDILDHICCMIEERLDLGWEYTKAEKEVFAEMGVLQLQAIEQETNILTQNKLIMKKRTKIIGLVAIVLMVAGFNMKMMQQPGAAIIWIGGVFIAVFGFSLFLSVDRFKYDTSNSGRIKIIIGYLAASIVLIGLCAKLMSWPFANLALELGGISFLIYFIVNNKITQPLKTH